MKKTMSWFTRIYLVISAFFLCLLIAAGCILWTVLDAYEASRPKHAAEEVFEDFFVDKNVDEIVEIATMGNGFETKEQMAEALLEQLDGKELDYIAVSNDGEVQKYAVTADGTRIAYFTLSQNGEQYSYGFLGYSLLDMEIFATAKVNKTIIVPEGYTLMLNSIVVGKDYITTPQIAHRSNEYLPEGEEGLYLNEYTVKGFFYEPEIKVVSPEGKSPKLKVDEDNSTITAELVYDDTLIEEYSDYVIKIASIYTGVMSEDNTKAQLYQYIDKSSEFYQKVRKAQTNWFWDHDGHKIKNTEASQFFSHSDNVFSCRVTLTQEMYLGKKTEVNNVDLILYMRKVNGKYLLFNAVTNG